MKIILTKGHVINKQAIEFAEALGINLFLYQKRDAKSLFYERVSKDDDWYGTNHTWALTEDINHPKPTLTELANAKYFDFNVEEYRTNPHLIAYLEDNGYNGLKSNIWVESIPPNRAFKIDSDEEYGEFIVYLGETAWNKFTIDGELIEVTPTA